MSRSRKVKVVQEDTNREIVPRPAGIQCIDTRALRRMISWALGNCDRQSMILDTALDVLANETQKNRKKKEDLKKPKPQ